MATYKNIRIKKRGGGTRLQRVQVLKSGKYKFVKNTTKSTSKPKKKNKGGKSRTTNKRRNFTIPVALVGGAVTGFFSDIRTPDGCYPSPFENALEGNWKQVIHGTFYTYTGYHANTNRFMPQHAVGLKALLIGTAIHWIASKVGLNRYLGQAKVPFFRI